MRDAAKIIHTSICISTHTSYVRPRLSLTARNIASPSAPGPRRQQIARYAAHPGCSSVANTRFALRVNAAAGIEQRNPFTIAFCQA